MLESILHRSRSVYLLFSLLIVSALSQAAESEYTFGVVPQQSATQLAEAWSPLLAEVSRRSGVTLRFRTNAGIPEFEKRLALHEYDFAYMNPLDYVIYHDVANYQAILREKGRKLKGIVVVRKVSEFHSLEDLQGKRFAYSAPGAFAATQLVQAELARRGITVNASFVLSHESVYRAVAAGVYAAGGGIPRTFESLPEEIRGQLRVLSTTDGYSPHALAVSRTVPDSIRSKVVSAFLSLDSDDQGRALLEPLAFKGLIPAQDVDWNDVRALGLTSSQPPKTSR